MMRRNALAMGAAVVAAVPVVVSPLTVAAVEPMTPIEWLDYYGISSGEAVAITLWTEDAFWPVYYTALMNIIQMPYINGVPIDPVAYGGGHTFSGRYLRNGVYHSGSVTFWGKRVYQNGVAGNFPLFVGDDCSIYVAVAPHYPIVGSGGFTCSMYRSNDRPVIEVELNGTSTSTVSINGSGFNPSSDVVENRGVLFHISGGVCSYYSAREMPSDIRKVCSLDGTSGQLLGSLIAMPDLPTSTLYEEINQDNALDYIREVLTPWAIEHDPEIEPYLFIPEEPYEPIYPTEFAEGVPKSWTIENPRLPSYDLDLQLPTADFDTVDVSTPLEHHATGIRFWWALLGEVLDHFGVKELVIFALALGLIVTILTRLGR